MNFYFGLDGAPISSGEAETLLRDDLARRVAHTTITTEHGQISVSTVFLVVNHGFGGTPLLWETMVFGGDMDNECDRYSSREDAERGHRETVALVRADLDARGVAVIAEDSFRPE